MNAKNKFICFILTLLLGFLYSIDIYGSKNNKENLLGYLKYVVKFETKYPYYLKKARKLFFKDGWNTSGPIPQAIKRDSFFEFNIFKKRNIKVYLDIENNNYIRLKRPLILDLKINGEFLKKVKIDHFFSIGIDLHKEQLKTGTNVLSFSVVGNTPSKPKDSNNFPGVWFLIKGLNILNMPEISDKFISLNDRKNSEFHQPSNSNFTIAVDSKYIMGFDFNTIQFEEKFSCGYLVVEKYYENKKRTLLINKKINNKNSSFRRLQFKNNDGKFLLNFSFKSEKKNSFLTWLSFNILKRKKDENKFKLEEIDKIKNLHNIIIITLDAARYDLIGKKMNGIEIMPNVNDFSKKAYNFTDFYANAPYTEAGVASMFTGLLPEVHTLRYSDNKMPISVRTLQDYLKKEGFKTHAFTGNPVLLRHNLLRGFDTTKLIFNIKNGKWKGTSYNNIKPILDLISKIDKYNKNYLYIHLLPPHKPYKPPGLFSKKIYENRQIQNNGFSKYTKAYLNWMYKNYLKNAEYSDNLTGIIINSLKKNKLFNKSLIIITADHGEAFGEHNILGHGPSAYKEMIHIPFMLKLPFQEKSISIKNKYSQIDLLPTIASLICNRKIKSWQGLSVFLSERNFNRSIYSRATGKLLKAGLLHENYKYIYNTGIDELYHINNDLYEKKNFSKEKKFLNLLLKQKLFMKYFKNKKWKVKFGINPIIKKNESFKSILKTLGYL